jgi:monoterpene epsilon-lactone hydrolase
MTTTHHPEHLVDRVAMAAMRSMLGSAKGSVNGPGARKAFDEIMEQVPAASGVAYEAAIIGGVSGWWCRPEDAMKGAAVLYLHGGGYVVGTSQAYQHVVGQVAARAKVAAFVPEYRLAPEYPFPAAFEDAQATYEGLVAEGFTKIAFAGDSAGGGLALILLSRAAAEARTGSGPIPKGAAVISAWTDLALAGESMVTRADADPLSTPASLASMARLYLAGRDPRDPLASPLYGDLAGLPPVRMHVGEDDVLLDDAVRYGERFEQEGGTIQVHTWQGMIHVFPSNAALLKAAKEALDDVGDFLNRQLLGEPVAAAA